jgi:hypothetical protein
MHICDKCGGVKRIQGKRALDEEDAETRIADLEKRLKDYEDETNVLIRQRLRDLMNIQDKRIANETEEIDREIAKLEKRKERLEYDATTERDNFTVEFTKERLIGYDEIEDELNELRRSVDATPNALSSLDTQFDAQNYFNRGETNE